MQAIRLAQLHEVVTRSCALRLAVERALKFLKADDVSVHVETWCRMDAIRFSKRNIAGIRWRAYNTTSAGHSNPAM